VPPTFLRCTRRLLLGAALAAALAPSFAQERTLRIVHGASPGTSLDILARLIADKMRVSLGHPVTVENRPGAGGSVAAQSVKSAGPNSSTVFLTASGTVVAFPHSNSQLGWDTLRDFVPVAHLTNYLLAFGVAPSVPAKTLAEYLDLVRKGPEHANVAAAGGRGAPPMFLLDIVAKSSGVKLNDISYKSTGQAIIGLQNGEISAAMLLLADIGNLAKQGKARLLATSGAARSQHFPDVPTLREAGFDIDGAEWHAMFAPAGTPKELVDAWARAAIDAVRSPDVRQRLDLIAVEAVGAGPAELAPLVKRDYDIWGRIIRESGYKAN
jgi:tripartite-type tricarboxylate transporter receptor subunit TctC